ncbi:1-acyl-sn-glycerol-3-phosphate acyltransferase [Sphingomonas sp. HDW15A]|uniref:lysophospholipid acyltransferase family protein n=1 Tax=Sphingomonas sp. HDW15A TaxID=2714942 RepID=UPI00140A565B|nr:lysophospholipid acyltransferase family protein [Sphingomonas sp. HDW15A]QIK95433.1 1-acyl-sn-glycerol-3-phosphate acyltransferase [Sphingomonas sp. HDW15A]
MGSAATATGNSSRWRAYVRLTMLIGWFAICIGPHLAARAVGRSHWPRRFLAGVARIAGADVRRHGPRPGAGHLILANHISWLDIPVLAGATGCAFVSKAEIRDHWFLRWIAEQNATVYVDRAARRDVHDQAASLREKLQSQQPLAVFPEGTVGDGRALLPFKPALLSAVAPPPDGVQVVPVAIDYHHHAEVIAWDTDKPGLHDFLRVLGRSASTTVTVRVLEPLPAHGNRKALARSAAEAIAGALATSSTSRPAL